MVGLFVKLCFRALLLGNSRSRARTRGSVSKCTQRYTIDDVSSSNERGAYHVRGLNNHVAKSSDAILITLTYIFGCPKISFVNSSMYAGFHPDSWWEVTPAAELSDEDE
jgi:hypothetical protein